jgi:hypothetical protein
MALKVTGIVVGALLALGGLIAAGGGGATLATIGSDGTVGSGQQSFATSGAALVSSSADLRRPHEVSDIVGDPRVRLSVHATAPSSGVFVGVGPAADVERYLASAPIDEVTDFDVDPFKMKHHPRGGSARPEAPGKQSFWTAKASGTDGATLHWKAQSGEYRMVVMNADGSPGVRTRGDVAVTIPHTSAISWSLIGGGLALLLAGIATIALSVRASAPSPRRSPAYSEAR